MFNKEEKEYLKTQPFYIRFFITLSRLTKITSDKIIFAFVIFILATIFLASPTAYLVKTKIEMDTFNKFSKTKVNYFQALIMDLKVTPDYK